MSNMCSNRGGGGSMSARDFLSAHTELKEMEREVEQLKNRFREQTQHLEYLHQRMEELQKTRAETREQRFKLEEFLKDKETNADMEMAGKEMKEAMVKQAEIQRLEEEYAELKKRKQEVELQALKYSHYEEFMLHVLKLTKFDNVETLTDYFENLHHIRDHLYQRDNQVQEQKEQQRRTLQILKEQHDLLWLQKNYQLSQLQTELEKARSEALIWEHEWNKIQGTAAKKTLELGQIKMATLNLYEMTKQKVWGEEVDINDTEKHLEEIKVFMLDYMGIVKQHQTCLQREHKKKTRANTKYLVSTCLFTKVCFDFSSRLIPVLSVSVAITHKS